jgi:peptidoglycan/LPS O-acetylase OafA/YrhL
MLTPPNSPIKYRGDIDGLRAVAVFAVIAFHLQLPITGGYVGVDVFFVISGYLIGAILLRDLDAGVFSFRGFYERRTRRILPALLAMLLGTSVLACHYYLPNDLIGYGKALIAASLSASNFYFFTQDSYFSSGGPLLHTWSLAVEEQFYFAFPIFLVILYKVGRSFVRSMVLLICLLSLVVSVAMQHRFPVANFYMPYTRAWELLLGTVLVLKMLPVLASRWWREAVTWVGAGLILLPLTRYTSGTSFPGMLAIPPCLGAAMILYSGEHGESTVKYFLSTRPMKFLGRISYSLYLIHWPLIVFGRQGFLNVNFLSHRQNLVVYILISISLAWLSWRFIEVPTRFGQHRLPPPLLFISVGSGLLAFAALGVGILFLHGLAFRYPPQALAIASHTGDTERRFFREGTCFLVGTTVPVDTYRKDICLYQSAGRKSWLLLGDSHAGALAHALQVQLPQVDILEAVASNCKPFPYQEFPSQWISESCGKLMEYIYGDFLVHHSVSGLIVEARWKDRDLSELAKLAMWCQSRKIPLIVMGPSEEYDDVLPSLLARSIRDHDPTIPSQHRISQIEALDETMEKEAVAKWKVPYVSLIQEACVSGKCREYVDNAQTIPMIFDHDHYTDEGANWLVGKLVAEGKLTLSAQTKPD